MHPGPGSCVTIISTAKSKKGVLTAPADETRRLLSLRNRYGTYPVLGSTTTNQPTKLKE